MVARSLQGEPPYLREGFGSRYAHFLRRWVA
jgi:hypothetical protein